MKRFIANLVDGALNRYAPVVHGRTVHAFTTTGTVGADWLSEVEEHFDSLPPWQRHDHDHDDDMSDELWAAMQRHPVGKKRGIKPPQLKVVSSLPVDAGDSPGVDGSQAPAGAGSRVEASSPRAAAASATGAGGPTSETDLTVVIAGVLRDCGTPWATTTAGILARELSLRFQFHHK